VKRRGKRRLTGEHFAAVPVEVLTSEACRTLPAYAFRVLIAFAAEYRGKNNGDIALTWSMAKAFGIASKKQLVASIAMLQERNLIQKTRQGGKKPLGPCLYAVTWRAIDELRPKIEIGPNLIPSHAWAKWTSAPRGDQTEINQQHHRGTASAPQGVPIDPVSAPQGDQRSAFIGTTGSPPSRIWAGVDGTPRDADG
jgi:hypothetical protein